METRNTGRLMPRINLRRIMTGVVFVFAIIITLVTGGQSSPASAAVATASAEKVYWYQGRGVPIDSPPGTIGVVNDLGGSADFAPAQGTRTMDQSVAVNMAVSDPKIRQDLEDGKTVTLDGFSLGALSAGDEAESLANAGVDTRNLRVVMNSDGRMAETGALDVLQPFGPVLSLAGITTSGARENYGDATVTSRCIKRDFICDVKDPFKDPVGFVDSAIGFHTFHNGTDPLNNYNNLDNMKKTTTQDGNVTVEVYTPSRSAIASLLSQGGIQVTPEVERVINAFILSKGGPGQVQTYKSLPEAIAEAVGAPLPEQTIELLDAINPKNVETTLTNGGNDLNLDNILPSLNLGDAQDAAESGGATASDLSVVAPIADAALGAFTDGTPAQEWIDQGIETLNTFANGGVVDSLPALQEAAITTDTALPVAPALDTVQEVVNVVAPAPVAEAASQALAVAAPVVEAVTQVASAPIEPVYTAPIAQEPVYTAPQILEPVQQIAEAITAPVTQAQSYTAPAEPAYVAPVATEQVQQVVDAAASVVEQVAPQLAPQVTDVANQFAGQFAGALAGFTP